MSTLK